MIIDIRGTNGSGKSWIVHQLLKMDHQTIQVDNEHYGYQIPELHLGILGQYTMTCGGCDTIPSQDEVCDCVRYFAKRDRFTILEGLLVSHTFQRYYELAKELGDYHFFFLDTPLTDCIERVTHRRMKAGQYKPFDPRNLIKDFHQIRSVRRRMLEHNMPVHDLHWETAYEDILGVLRCS